MCIIFRERSRTLPARRTFYEDLAAQDAYFCTWGHNNNNNINNKYDSNANTNSNTINDTTTTTNNNNNYKTHNDDSNSSSNNWRLRMRTSAPGAAQDRSDTEISVLRFLASCVCVQIS